jgi:hypothetical protein
MRAPRAMKMPSTAQRSHAGKKAPKRSKEGAPASEQPPSDSSGSARTPALIGRRLIQRSAQQERRAAEYGLHRDSAANFILTLCRAPIPHHGCGRRGDDVRTISQYQSCTRITASACRKLLKSYACIRNLRRIRFSRGATTMPAMFTGLPPLLLRRSWTSKARRFTPPGWRSRPRM